MVLASILQKPLNSSDLSFLSCKIRELDCLLSKVLPGPTFSDILSWSPK